MSKNKSISEQLDIFLRARYPILYINTYEEGRISKIIDDIANQKNMKLFIWSLTSGLTNPNDVNMKEELNPVKVVEYIINYSDSAIFILRDMHAFFNSPDVIRIIRDYALSCMYSNTYKPIIITSPVLKIPQELEKVITVLDLDLPNVDQIKSMVMSLINVKKSLNDTITDEKIEKIVKSCCGLTEEEIGNTLSKSWVQDKDLNPATILEEKEQIIKKSGILEYYECKEKYSDVGGLDILKEWLEERGESFTDKAREFGLPQPKGVLLLGIPGTGKSLIAKSLANIWGLPLIKMDVGKIFAGIVGASEANMRKAISIVESVSPCILFIDEIEKGLSGTASSNFSDGGTASRVFSNFLSWLNDKTAPVFVIATANDVRQLPPELLRKGRFDEIFFVELPDIKEREEIFGIHIGKPRELHKGRDVSEFDLKELAKLTDGFSGAEIEQVVIAGLFKAFKAKEELSQEHLVQAISETVPLSKTMKEQIDFLNNWVIGRARYASSSRNSGNVKKSHIVIDDTKPTAELVDKLKVQRRGRAKTNEQN